ncbi:MAG: prephenate dehydrogenase [Candidatus Micrarchaeota archaeon]
MQIAIIGNGRMGRWFAEYFRKKGFVVSVYEKENKLDDIYLANYVMVAVTLDKTDDVLRQITGKVHADQIVFDIASVKSHIINEIKKLKCRIASIHPMFGESAKDLKGQEVVIISNIGKKAEHEEMKGLFKEARLSQMTVEEHDKMMAYSQVLPYLLALTFGRMTKGKKLIEPPVFQMQKKVYEKVMEEEEMVKQIIMLNPYAKEVAKEIGKG